MKRLILLAVIGVLLLCGNTQAVELSDDELHWLTQNIYWETRNQKSLGQVLVGFVTLNRMNNKRWPGTVYGVVTQRNQFSWFWDGKSDRPKEMRAWKSAVNVAKFVCAVYDLEENFVYREMYWYHTDDVDPYWNNNLKLYTFVEKHMFYVD